MMKYIQPSTEVYYTDNIQAIAVSIIENGTANDSQILTKEDNDWDMWEE